jgi:hypothetical protein
VHIAVSDQRIPFDCADAVAGRADIHRLGSKYRCGEDARECRSRVGGGASAGELGTRNPFLRVFSTGHPVPQASPETSVTLLLGFITSYELRISSFSSSLRGSSCRDVRYDQCIFGSAFVLRWNLESGKYGCKSGAFHLAAVLCLTPQGELLYLKPLQTGFPADCDARLVVRLLLSISF